MVDERELYLRFNFYDDEELLRILTVERAEYRGEALAAAERVLMRRGITPPIPPPPDLPLLPARAVDAEPRRPASPYQFIDLVVDVLLIGFGIWAMRRLQDWTEPIGGLLGNLVYIVLFFALLRSAASLRERWRAKQWKD